VNEPVPTLVPVNLESSESIITKVVKLVPPLILYAIPKSSLPSAFSPPLNDVPIIRSISISE